MVKRTSAQWQALFAEQKQRGLTAADFCREKQLCPKYFSLGRRQLSSPDPDKSKTTAFVQAKSAPPPQALTTMTLRSSNYELVLPTSVSVLWLAELITALT